MMWFLLCVGLLIGGYFIYGTFVEKKYSGLTIKDKHPPTPKQMVSTMCPCPRAKSTLSNC